MIRLNNLQLQVVNTALAEYSGELHALTHTAQPPHAIAFFFTTAHILSFTADPTLLAALQEIIWTHA